MITKPIDGALWALARGWRVFPLADGGKTPRFTGWQKWALAATRESVLAFHAAHPGANWGLYCGASGLAVVDLDKAKAPGEQDGSATWAEMLASGKDCPDTLTLKTARGGRHLVFSGQTKSINRWAPSIDCKSLGGYIVLPGGVFVEDGIPRPYTIEADRDPAPLPDWTRAAIEAARPRLERPSDEDLAGSIPDGRRNETLAQWGGVLRAQGLARDEIEAALLALNASRCAVPLPDSEVQAIAASVGRYARGQADAVTAFAAAGLVRPPAADPIVAIDGAALLRTPPPEHRPLLFGVFDRGASVAVCGKSKARKSWFTLQAALLGAAGRPIGPWAAVGQWRVLYADTELQPDSLHRRAHAAGKALSLHPDALGDRFHLAALRGRLPASADDAAGALVDLARSTRADVVFLDSLYSFSNGREDGEDLLAMVRMLREVRGAVPGLATVAVRHDGKGDHGEKALIDRGSGHSVFGRDVDAMLAIDAGEEEGTFALRWVVRDYADPGQWSARWEEGAFVDAGRDVRPQTGQAKRQAAARAARDAAILSALEAAGDAGAGYADLEAAAGVSRGPVSASLRALAASGRLQEVEEGPLRAKRFFLVSGMFA